MRSPGNLHRRGCDGTCRAACFDDMMHGMTEGQGDPLAPPPRSWRPRAMMLGGAAALLFVAGALQAGAPDKGVRAQASGAAIPAASKQRIPDAAYWQAQQALIDAAVARWPRAGRAPRTHVLAIAAMSGGGQFAREARLARDSFATWAGSDTTLVMLNEPGEEARVPQVTPRGLTAALAAMARAGQPARDTLLVYLVSHGAPDASLETELPSGYATDPVAAEGLRAALDASGFRRRVIIISACFAGSWMDALRSPDTIVIAAAAANRTSFGCSPDRDLTYFGEALLRQPVARGAALSRLFDNAQARVEAMERETGMSPPSSPQYAVGANMHTLWGRAEARPATIRFDKR